MKGLLRLGEWLISLLLLLLFLRSVLLLWPGEVLGDTKSFFKEPFDFVGSYLKGNWGYSWQFPTVRVSDLIWQDFWITLQTALPAFVLVNGGALTLALVGVQGRGTSVSSLVDEVFLILLSMPVLLFAPILIFVFAVKLRWLPVAFLDSPAHFVLPVVSLCLRPMARLGVLLKVTLEQEYQKPHILVARAKGLSEKRVLLFHVLPSSRVIWVRMLGPVTVGLFSGSVLVESLFAIPGIGSLFIGALSSRDYPLLTGAVWVLSAFLIGVNLILESWERRG